MELVLTRVYKRGGTNGTLTFNGHFVCFTIELPWKENKQNSSCIPEGIYELRSRTSTKFHNHLEILDVPNRSYILIHPANWPKELHGCIGLGNGWEITKTVPMVYNSKATCREFFAKVGKEFILTITSKSAILWE